LFFLHDLQTLYRVEQFEIGRGFANIREPTLAGNVQMKSEAAGGVAMLTTRRIQPDSYSFFAC
jgi:hypothetical protein